MYSQHRPGHLQRSPRVAARTREGPEERLAGGRTAGARETSKLWLKRPVIKGNKVPMADGNVIRALAQLRDQHPEHVVPVGQLGQRLTTLVEDVPKATL